MVYCIFALSLTVDLFVFPQAMKTDSWTMRYCLQTTRVCGDITAAAHVPLLTPSRKHKSDG